MTIRYKDDDYEVATTLRVAYELQGQHNHKPYGEVLKNFNALTIEDQIGLIYAAFKIKNPDEAKAITRTTFCSWFLDNVSLKQVMKYAKEIIQGISGATDDEVAEIEHQQLTEGNSQAGK